MCCFSTKTEVHGTSIFARATKAGTQALVYQMRYTAEAPTAMILPLPVALPSREDSVRFTSLKEYPSFFYDLGRGFEEPRSKGGPARAIAVAAAPPLEVHDVGDFVATFVPSMKDFGRVDSRFVLPKQVWDRIPAYADYGFAVFQLKDLSGTPHPIALELDTRMPGHLFFPTVHIHDGTVHEKESFDHVLYAQDETFDARTEDAGGFVRSHLPAMSFADAQRSHGLLNADLRVHKATLRGVLPNRDTTFERIANRARVAGCSRCDTAGTPDGAWLPVTAALGGLGWIIRRRNELR
jgi:MYXO-CTERM domain-containing protein